MQLINRLIFSLHADTSRLNFIIHKMVVLAIFAFVVVSKHS